MYKIDIIDMYS